MSSMARLPERSKTSRRTSEGMPGHWVWPALVGLLRRLFGQAIFQSRKHTIAGGMRRPYSAFTIFLWRGQAERWPAEHLFIRSFQDQSPRLHENFIIWHI